jgi:phospholipase C
MDSDRRKFLKSIGAISGAAALGSLPGAKTLAQHVERFSTESLPAPEESGIDHIVVVMMENRSFDHLFGWIRGADGKQQGLVFKDSNGVSHSTHRLAPDFTGCGHPDPDHSYDGGRIQYDNRRMDGFLLDSMNDIYALGYYGRQDRPFHNALALQYTVCDRYFCSILGPTFPNRMYSHAAQTDRLSNTFTLSTLPTIWDRLAAAGVSGTYYFSNLPFLGLWGAKYIPISRPYEQFLVDAAAGTLPAVSFIDPRFTVADLGEGNDDHPHADVRAGDAFLADTFFAVANGPLWPRTVFVITYDEWGGFFDHVAPPRATAANGVDQDIVRGKTLLGFRIPVCIASPFSRKTRDDDRDDDDDDDGNRKARVANSVFDHTSILKFIEWRWQLSPLSPRDASSDITNLAHALRFRDPDFSVPTLPHPVAPPPVPCGQADFFALPGTASNLSQMNEHDAWSGLLRSGLLNSWDLKLK